MLLQTLLDTQPQSQQQQWQEQQHVLLVLQHLLAPVRSCKRQRLQQVSCKGLCMEVPLSWRLHQCTTSSNNSTSSRHHSHLWVQQTDSRLRALLQLSWRDVCCLLAVTRYLPAALAPTPLPRATHQEAVAVAVAAAAATTHTGACSRQLLLPQQQRRPRVTYPLLC